MKNIFEMLGISKQAHWKACRREAIKLEAECFLLREVEFLRRLHPRMGARKIYSLLEPECMGRDQFIRLLSENSLLLRPQRNPKRTTFSATGKNFPNRLAGRVFNGPDQVWVSDITYFFSGEECFYIVMIMDIYTRRVLGYNVDTNMRAESCLKALKMALKQRGDINFEGKLIHHSDKGVQYLSDAYIEALEQSGILTSTCEVVYENTHMERLNGIIKNDYMHPWQPVGQKSVKRALAKAIFLYNNQRPHESLNDYNPVNFENWLESVPIEERPQMIVYTDPKTIRNSKLRNQLDLFNQERDM